MTTENRLEQLLDAEVERKYPTWQLVGVGNGWRLLSPVEPCNKCGTPIFLMDRPSTRPHWYELGEMYGEDTLFPGCRCKPHGCQDDDLTDVEAALLSTESEVPA